MPCEISPRLVVIVSIRLEIPSVLRDHLNLSLPLLLVLIDLLILVNVVHKLAHAPNWFPGQGFPQIVLDGQADLESSYRHIVKVPIYFVEHFPVSIKISFQGFPLVHGHR